MLEIPWPPVDESQYLCDIPHISLHNVSTMAWRASLALRVRRVKGIGLGGINLVTQSKGKHMAVWSHTAIKMRAI